MPDRPPSELPPASVGPLLEIAAGRSHEPRTPHDHAALRQAELLGYHVLCPLDAGGLAEVWRCYHEDLDRDYALKAAHREQPQANELIRREAETLKQCAGPGVVALEAQGGDGDHRFLILEFIDGDPLDEYTIHGNRRPEEVADLVARVCQIVARVHAKGYLHGDLKPSNILVRAEDQEPILIDFGLACRQNAQGAAITGDFQRGGTERFLAPEYRHESGWLPTVAGDIYALGKTLEFLVGPDDAPLPKSLQRIVERACHPAPDRRYATPVLMAQALNDWALHKRRPARTQYFVMAAALLLGTSAAVLLWPANPSSPTIDATPVAVASANPLDGILRAIAADENVSALQQLGAVPEPQRGWEWRHLWSRASLPPSVTHLVYPRPGTASSIAPSGSRVLVGTHDRTLYWIDFDGAVTTVATAPELGSVTHAVARLDGTFLATDITGRVWMETERGLQAVLQLPADRPQVCWPAANPKQFFFWSHISQNLGLIDLDTRRWEALRQSDLVLPAPSSPGASLAVDRQPGGFTSTFLNPAGMPTTRDTFPPQEIPTCLDRDPDTGQAVVGTNRGSLRVYHPDGSLWHTLTLRADEAVTAAVITSDENRLFAADDTQLYVIDLGTGDVVLTLPTNTPGLVRDIHWDQHSGTLILATDLGATQWKAADYNTIMASR